MGKDLCKIFSVVFGVTLLILFKTTPLKAFTVEGISYDCGSYKVMRCEDAETDTEISPYFICTRLTDICCKNETECEKVEEATLGPPSPPAVPPPSDISNDKCGVFQAGECRGSSDYKIIPNPINCDPTTNECCIEQQYCSTPPPLPPVEIPPPAPPIVITGQECKDEAGIETALGCIPYDPGNLVKWLLGFGLSLAGGIAFLLMTWGAFLYITSQGNPDQLQKAKETIVSAIGGLLFIIFAVFLLRLIGVDILKIPGFEK